MTALYSNAEVAQLLAMPDCMAILKSAYVELAHGRGVNRTRSDCLVPAGGGTEQIYGLKSMDGVAPHLGIGAVRINSDIVGWPRRNGVARREKTPAAGGRWVGLVLLFSTKTGEPLAILPDGVMQRMRVGAANGLGIEAMAREDATELAILGSGWQAGAQLMAACASRPLRRVRCFSPREANRTRFCTEMTASLGIPVEPYATAEDAVRGADIVMCATNAVEPIFRREWIAPGVHLSAIKPAEIEPRALKRADRLVVHTADTAPLHYTADNLPAAKGWSVQDEFDFASAPTMADLLAGRYPGRTGPDEVTAFVNNLGMGYQFAVLGALLLQRASGKGLGHQLPTEWFTQDVHP